MNQPPGITAKKRSRLFYSFSPFFVSLLTFHSSPDLLAQPKTVGYYAAWKSSSLPFNKVDYPHLTHINVAFAYPLADGSLSYPAGGIPFSQLVSSAHAAGKKVLISLGGASNSTYFPDATASSSVRGVLINAIVSFLQTNAYDGVDIDWEVPANSTQTAQATALVQEMRSAFNQTNSSWLITMAVPPTNYGGQHFDYTNLVGSVDWFNLMCYDFYGSWSGYAGHDSPLYQPPNDPTKAGADSEAVTYMVSRGVPKSKLTLGIPFYGVQFNAPGLYQRMTNTSVSNPLYQDVVNDLGAGWTYHWDDGARVPYLLNGDSTQFITFEDTNSVKQKVAFSIRQQLGGVMIWELSQDLLSNGTQPLLEAIGRTTAQLTAVDAPVTPPGRFLLYENYPNPFNPTTVISFQLPVASYVSVRIFDVLGKEVATLVNEERSAGRHTVQWNAGGFPSGVYFCRLTADGAVQTRKLVLVR